MKLGDYFGLKNSKELQRWSKYSIIEAELHFQWDMFFDMNSDFKFVFSNRENSVYLGLGHIEYPAEYPDFFSSFESLPKEVFFFYQQTFYKDKSAIVLPQIQILKTPDGAKIRYFQENGVDPEITTYKDFPARNILFQENHEPDENGWNGLFQKAKNFLIETSTSTSINTSTDSTIVPSVNIPIGNSKIVLSRKTQFRFKNRVHAPKLFLNLYKEMFYNFFVQTKHHYFMGSSPERLLKFSNSLFFTEAVAGTRSLDKKEELLTSEKDKKEQKIVLDEILKSIQNLSVKTNVGETKLYEYKNLVHLKTEVCATPSTTNIFEWVNNIHPTPAVCGYPREKAYEFLKNSEPYKRENYASCIGILQRNHMDIAVSIRCAEVYRNLVTAYTGVGVVTESNRELEWQELDLKLENIRAALEI